jgi:hypothetical protein
MEEFPSLEKQQPPPHNTYSLLTLRRTQEVNSSPDV